jgi:hypothetical protein
MRPLLSLTTVFLVLICIRTVSAQDFLAEYKDKNDPCARFKMRILMAFNNANHRLQIKKTEGGIDHKMIWNPCLKNEPQFAYFPLQLTPDWQRSFAVRQRARFWSLITNIGAKNQAEFSSTEFPGGFRFKWLHKQ